VSEYTGRDAALLRQSHGLRQIDVGRAMVPAVSRQRVHQLEHRPRLTGEQIARMADAIMAASAERGR
jgi:hypothetical protein